jgi:ABC-type multidrug transport system ATPase subunit
MRILVTLLEPSVGEVTFGGHDLRRSWGEDHALLGYFPLELNFFP